MAVAASGAVTAAFATIAGNAATGSPVETTVTDLRWIAARLQRSGPNAPFADLTEVATTRSKRLARLLGQIAHLLEPTTPEHSRVDILCSWVADDPDWGPAATTLTTGPALMNRWPIPSTPHAALLRSLTGHRGRIAAVAISAAGEQLATGGFEGDIQIWQARTGRRLARLTAPGDSVETLAFARDGTWLAAAGVGSVRIWDLSTGTQRAKLPVRTGQVRTVDIAPDGSWLAAVGMDGSVRAWDSTTGRRRFRITGIVRAMAIAPDSTWFATGTSTGQVRMWDARTGEQRGELAGTHNGVEALTIAPDGTWIAVGSRTVRIWHLNSPPNSTAASRPHRRSRSPPTAAGSRPPTATRCASGTQAPAGCSPPCPSTTTGPSRWRWLRTGPGLWSADTPKP